MGVHTVRSNEIPSMRFLKTAVLYAQYLTIIKYYDEQSVHLNRNSIKWPNGMSILFLIKILIYLSSLFIL